MARHDQNHPFSRRYFVGGSDVRIMDSLLRLWPERPGVPGPEDLSGGSHSKRLCARAGANPCTSPALAAHAAFVTALSALPPLAIPLDADALDLEDRAAVGWLIIAEDEGPLPPWRDKRGEAEAEHLTDKSSPVQVCNRASAKPSTSPALAAHVAFVAALSGHPPRAIPLDADALDLEDRADHIGKVFAAFSVYVAVILDDTAQNAPGTLELPHVEAILADLAADVTGAIQHAAEDMGWRVA
jgi:hypothetical protein